MSTQFPAYNLKAVMHETGLSPATLRAWERRYGLFKPQRSPGGHRLYTQHEIDMLKWLVARQAEGLSISLAVEMWRNQEQATQGQYLPASMPTPPATASLDGATFLEQLRDKWLNACQTFDELAAEQALSQAFAIAAPEVVCSELLQKGLSELGERWYQGAASVQQEHFASALTMRRLNALVTAASPPTRPGRLLAACPPGEAHDLSLLMLTFLLRWRGWDVIYLGADVPLTDLADTLQSTSPVMVLSVAQTLPGAAALKEQAAYVTSRGVPMAYGGGIFKAIPALTERIPGSYLGHEMNAVPQVLDLLLSRPPALPVTQPLPSTYMDELAAFKAKEALIVSTVSATLQKGPISPQHLKEANIQFTRAVAAALALGDIHLLSNSADWLNGLLKNHGLSPALAVHYYAVYRQAVQQHLGNQAMLILGWLDQNKALDR